METFKLKILYCFKDEWRSYFDLRIGEEGRVLGNEINGIQKEICKFYKVYKR